MLSGNSTRINWSHIDLTHVQINFFKKFEYVSLVRIFVGEKKWSRSIVFFIWMNNMNKYNIYGNCPEQYKSGYIKPLVVMPNIMKSINWDMTSYKRGFRSRRIYSRLQYFLLEDANLNVNNAAILTIIYSLSHKFRTSIQYWWSDLDLRSLRPLDVSTVKRLSLR